MFGFSLQKLILLVVLFVVVIYGKRLISSVGSRTTSVGGGQGAPPVGEDTLQCNICGAYVAASNPSSCGRSDCPYKS